MKAPRPVADIVHDLRNPLAGVRAALQVVRGRLQSGTEEREILIEALSRLDDAERLLVELLGRPPSEHVAHGSGVHAIELPAERVPNARRDSVTR